MGPERTRPACFESFPKVQTLRLPGGKQEADLLKMCGTRGYLDIFKKWGDIKPGDVLEMIFGGRGNKVRVVSLGVARFDLHEIKTFDLIMAGFSDRASLEVHFKEKSLSSIFPLKILSFSILWVMVHSDFKRLTFDLQKDLCLAKFPTTSPTHGFTKNHLNLEWVQVFGRGFSLMRERLGLEIDPFELEDDTPY